MHIFVQEINDSAYKLPFICNFSLKSLHFVNIVFVYNTFLVVVLTLELKFL